MYKLVIFLIAVLTFTLVVPAAAQLYENGPIDGHDLGLTINFGFVVSDQFTINQAATAAGLTFGAWLFPGDVLESVEVSITSSEFGGTSYFDQTVRFAPGTCFSNGGFNVCAETGSFLAALNAGTYWLNLQNAVVNNGDPAYWDVNSGPSLASESSLGTVPSESFTILGGCGSAKNAPPCGPPPPTTPEPSSLLLLGSGVATLFGVLGALRAR